MPLGKISLDSILGLNTERNDTSGINPPAWSSMGAWAVENASSGATSPQTLVDCTNIIISRNKQAAARTAFLKVWDFTSTYGSKNGFNTKGMYAIPNSSTNSLVFSWILDDVSDDADIANFATSVNQNMKCSVYYAAGVKSATFSSFLYLKPDFGWFSSSAQFPLVSFNIAHYLTSYSNIYVFSSNGVFRTSNTNGYRRDVTSLDYNEFKRVTLPLVKNLSAQITASPEDANRWFESGSYVDIKVLVTEQLSGTQVYHGKPSRTLSVLNTGTKSSIQLTFVVDNTNLILPGSGVEVYRTPMYAPGAAAPTVFKKCWESALSKGVTAAAPATTTTFTNIELTLNDASVAEFQEIYVSLNVESAQSQVTGLISAEAAAPPTARDVITYNNFSVYGNLMVPPFAALTLISLPNTDGLDRLQVGATNVPVTYVPNSIISPADTGVITSVSGTFEGLSSIPNSSSTATGNGYPLVIRPQDPNDSTKTAGTYSVPWVAIASTLVPTLVSGITYDVQVEPTATVNELFDIPSFPTTGFVAVVQTKTSGYLVALFSYQSFAGSGTGYKFSNCLAFGADFATSLTWGVGGLQVAANYVLYPLSATAITGLSVYPIGTPVTVVSPAAADIGFSLFPTYECYPTRLFNQNHVGTITHLSQIGPAPVFGPIRGTINFRGVYSKDAGELLEECAKTLCDAYNTAKTAEDPYAIFDDSPTAPVGRIRFESIYSGYNRFSTYTKNSTYNSGEGFYDQITAKSYRVDLAAPTVTYAEPIPINATQANIMQQKVQVIAGVAISKYNKPEEIPVGQNLTPTIVGDPLKPIIKMVNQYSQLLVFKQNEGTYKLDIQGQGAGIVPYITSSYLVDNTAWLLLPDSVQVFEGSAIYFSNKGFVSISPTGSITEMGATIATETLNLYAKIALAGNQNKVRSWTITQSRLYCCYFPYVNEDLTSLTYVFCFSTGQWTKWSGEISDIAVSAQGQLTLVEDIFQFQQLVRNEQQLQEAAIDTSNKFWSVIRQADFQNPSTTQIEDELPFTGLTVVHDDSIGTITISGFTTATPYSNLYKALMLYKNRTFWYLNDDTGYNITKLFGAEQNTSITLQLVDSQGDPVIPIPFTPSADDSLVTTVNTALYFNKFFISAPRGSTLSHFNECQIYTQEGIDYSNLKVGFNSTGQDSNFVITSTDATPPSAFVITTNGSYVVANSSIDVQFLPYYSLARSQYVFRVLVPLKSGRGRFIQMAIKHDTPEEVFVLNSIVYIYRDTASTKIKAHS
jgi:hypothetical protein